MKNIFLILAIVFSTVSTAQENKPSFEKEGNAIKGTFYFEDGSISQQGYYNKEGKLHGIWKSYDQEGKKIAMGQYTNGIKTGKWFFWQNDKLSEVTYSDNTIASTTVWSNSEIVANIKN